MNRMERNRQTVRPPSTGDIEETAALDGIELAESEAEDLSGIITALVMAAGEADRFDPPQIPTFPTSPRSGSTALSRRGPPSTPSSGCATWPARRRAPWPGGAWE